MVVERHLAPVTGSVGVGGNTFPAKYELTVESLCCITFYQIGCFFREAQLAD